MNEDKMRQQECEAYLDSTICEKSQEDRIKELEEAVSWLAIELAMLVNGEFANGTSTPETVFGMSFDDMPNVKILDSIPNLKSTIMEMLK